MKEQEIKIGYIDRDPVFIESSVFSTTTTYQLYEFTYPGMKE